LNPSAIRKAYEVVADRIGISATNDAAGRHTIGTLTTYQPSAKADRNHQYIQKQYQKRQSRLQGQGLYVGRTPLALLTKDKPGRRGYQYRDMDFYSDNDKSAWRPWITVDQLKRCKNFIYQSSMLAVKFHEKASIVHLVCIDTTTNKEVTFQCRKLVLGSGALGTARIALRSLTPKASSKRVPLLSNPHAYIPCVQPAMLGAGSEEHKLGFGQLSYFLDPSGKDESLSVASSYSYQSLMLYRTIGQIPLNYVDAKTINRYLLPGLIILLVQHPDKQSSDKYMQLIKDAKSPTGDKLSIHYELSPEDDAAWKSREKGYMSALRKLKTYPLKRVDPGHGSGIHYAGTLPYSDEEQPLHLSPSGRIHGTKHVYVADSSGFRFLPAKGLTFTLMANAHITAENALHDKA
jgi:hypothetical protein